MSGSVLEKISQEQLRKDPLPVLGIGDTVRVHVRVREGDKERDQVYTGALIARKGHGATETVTVRRTSYGVGMERVFPLHSPGVIKIEVERAGRTRRAKLYYLRGLSGKSSRIKERR
jgi:large subunit ribosomal protein L19